MALTTIRRRVRKDPLGHAALNTLRYYIGGTGFGVLETLGSREHDDTGAHNALEIPRTVGRVLYSAGYTSGTFNSRLSSVASAATGIVTATLAGSEFTDPLMAPVACPLTNGDTRPCIATCEVVSSTSVKTRLYKLTSVLHPAAGAANVWAAYDGGFSLAVHGLATLSTSAMAQTTQWQRRTVVSDTAAGWNSMVGNLGLARELALVEHTTAGEHDAVEVCRDYGGVFWDGVKYDTTLGSTFTGASLVSTGICEVTCAYTFASAADMLPFITPKPSSNLDILVVNPDPTTDRKFRTYGFRYDVSAHTWALADVDFTAVVYGA